MSEVGYSFSVLAAVLTLIAFSRYVIGFGALLLHRAGRRLRRMGSGIAAERVENVFLGCAFGRVAVALAEIARPGGLRPGRPQTPAES